MDQKSANASFYKDAVSKMKLAPRQLDPAECPGATTYFMLLNLFQMKDCDMKGVALSTLDQIAETVRKGLLNVENGDDPTAKMV